MSHKFRHYVQGKKKSKCKLIEAKRVVKTTETRWYSPSSSDDSGENVKHEQYDFSDEK